MSIYGGGQDISTSLSLALHRDCLTFLSTFLSRVAGGGGRAAIPVSHYILIVRNLFQRQTSMAKISRGGGERSWLQCVRF